MATVTRAERAADLHTAAGLRALGALLLLVTDDVAPDWEPDMRQIQGWTLEEREDVRRWASAVHLRASDNAVRVPAKPEILTTKLRFDRHGRRRSDL